MSKHKHFKVRISPDQPGSTATRPNYRKVIEAAILAGTMAPKPGTVSIINVQHDDWCAIFQGEACNCDPDIIQQPAVKR